MSGIGSQDFQNLSLAVQDLVRAMRENTEGTKRSFEVKGVAAQGGSGGTGQGMKGQADPTAAAVDRGFALSSMSKVLTSTGGASPAFGTLGSLVQGAQAGPAGVGAALVGLAAQKVAEWDSSNIGREQGRIGAFVGAPSHLTFDQAQRRANFETDQNELKARIKSNVDFANGFSANRDAQDPLADPDGGARSRNQAQQDAEILANVARYRERQNEVTSFREESDERARRRAEARMSRAIELGALNTEGGRATFERYFHHFQRLENNRADALDWERKMMQKSSASNAGAQRGNAHQ